MFWIANVPNIIVNQDVCFSCCCLMRSEWFCSTKRVWASFHLSVKIYSMHICLRCSKSPPFPNPIVSRWFIQWPVQPVLCDDWPPMICHVSGAIQGAVEREQEEKYAKKKERQTLCKTQIIFFLLPLTWLALRSLLLSSCFNISSWSSLEKWEEMSMRNKSPTNAIRHAKTHSVSFHGSFRHTPMNAHKKH